MERKTIVHSLVALNAVLLCIFVWLLISDKEATKQPVKQDDVETPDSLNMMEIPKDFIESSESSCVYEPGKGAGESVSGSLSGNLP